MKTTIYPSTHRLLLPETIWLETEDYTAAHTLSESLDTEQQRWHCYLNLLGLKGLAAWLSDRLPNRQIEPKIDVTKQIYYLEINKFTITTISVENLLDEMVRVSPPQIENQSTHFYALIEINEEAAEAIFRGIMRHDRLDERLSQYAAQDCSLKLANGDYSLPLSWFDPEPNHLITYCQHLSPDAIALSAANFQIATPNFTHTKLTQWLQNTAVEGWSLMENLLAPQLNLAFSTRSVNQEYRKGKLIDLGVELDNVTLALLVAISPSAGRGAIAEETESKLGVKVQLYPTSREQYLPPQVQLTLLSKAGKILQSVRARKQDNYIQLKPFKGKLGKRFSIEIALEKAVVREYFEL